MAEPSKELLQTIAANADPRVPLTIVLTMIERESGFDPTKRGADGEWGLMQLLPSTVRGGDIGYQGPMEELAKPPVNVKLGTGYLALLKDRHGSWPVAVRAYNGSGSEARAYAEGVFQRLPSWDRFVKANLDLFRAAVRSKGFPVVLGLAAAALVALFLLRRRAEA
jgi:soluble lytic murein transglycosylase-like protein